MLYPFLGQLRSRKPNANYWSIVVDLLLLLDKYWKIEQRGQTVDITVPLAPELQIPDLDPIL